MQKGADEKSESLSYQVARKSSPVLGAKPGGRKPLELGDTAMPKKTARKHKKKKEKIQGRGATPNIGNPDGRKERKNDGNS